MSLQNKHDRIADETYCERIAVETLAGVGGDHEWWEWPVTLIGHLRVPITAAEALLLPGGVAVDDAGPEGVYRTRTKAVDR